MPPTFVVLDDHELIRDGVVNQVLATFPSAEFAYRGGDLQEAVSSLGDNGVDLALVDLDLGTGHRVADIVSSFTMRQVPVVVVSAMASPEAVRAALESGAVGYVTKRAGSQDLQLAIRAALMGDQWVTRDVAEALVRPESAVDLTQQERRALTLYASGMTMGMVARRMNVAVSTAKHYIDNVRRKYAAAGAPAHTKTDLNALARHEGLIPN